MQSFSAFNDSGCTTVRSGVVNLFCQRKEERCFLKPPGTWYWYCYGLADTAPNRSIHTRNKKCGKYINSCLRVFSVSSTHIFSAWLCQGPSLSYLIPGVTWHALLSLLHYRARAFVLIARIFFFRIKFPSLSSPCVELVCIHATYQYSTQHAGCEALLRSVCILMFLFQV